MVIRPSNASDGAFIRELSAEAFGAFGDYRDLLPRWIARPGVVSFVAVDGRQQQASPCGMVMLGFYFGDLAKSWVYADVLAIAVAPAWRGTGLGRQLLRRAIRAAEEGRDSFDVRELRLTVADTNERAQRLFASEGFEVSETDHGRYDGGQLALRMRRPL